MTRLGRLGTILTALILFIPGCSREGKETAAVKDMSSQQKESSYQTYVETGDFPEIKKQGYLRVLMPRQVSIDFLPRSGDWLDRDRDLIKNFAEKKGLKPIYVYVNEHKDLIPSLLAGKGDLIAAGLTVTKNRKQKIAFTVPVTVVHEQVVYRKGELPVQNVRDLAGRPVILRQSSSYWETLQALKQKNSRIELEPAPETMNTIELLHGVATGKYDLTVADDTIIRTVIDYLPNLEAGFDLTGERLTAWAVRKKATKLKKELNKYLTRKNLLRSTQQEIVKEDLDGIKKRKTLRVLTRNNATTYFVWRGELLGFEYELARRFAASLGVRLEMIVPPTRKDLVSWLLAGKGDVIMAGMTITEKRKKHGIAFSRPYNYVSEIVVAPVGQTDMNAIADLTNRSIFVRPSSSYWKSVEKLKKGGLAVHLVPVPEEMETEEIIAKVAKGEYDLTVADSHILDVELTWRNDIKGLFPLGDPVRHGWAVRTNNIELLNTTNSFINKEYRGTFYNIIHKKYFKSPRKIRKHVEFRTKNAGQLSPYDDLVKKYAKKFGYDWRLIVSQMYQESRFDPEARSFAGAIGLMQMLPRTAEQLGFKDIRDPETGIQAGVRYLKWLRERFKDELPEEDRMWFILASYNAGYSHVFDARHLARELGLNPNRWFDNVEEAMLLLAKPEYARRARCGYCRGSEPVKYVREIRRRYRAYVEELDAG